MNVGANVNAYVTGSDLNGDVMILQPDGQWYRAPPGVSSVPVPIRSDLITILVQAVNQSTSMFVSADISAGRIWLAQENLNFSFVMSDTGRISIVEPAISNVLDFSWGFLEFTYSTKNGLWVDLSNVDFVGLPLGVSVKSSDSQLYSPPLQLGGLQQGAVRGICDDLKIQSTVDGYPWKNLCINDIYGNPLSVLSPNSYIQQQPLAFSDYWECYIDEVWSRYSTENLIINTQSNELGDVSCAVDRDFLVCSTDTGVTPAGQLSATITKPSSEDVFSCSSGPFSISATTDNLRKLIIPRLCAAFQRSTLLSDYGDLQPNGPPSTVYYSASNTTNWYSKLVHQWEIGGQGYAFPYDDVTSDTDVSEGKSQSGLLFSSTPGGITIYVGGALGPLV